MSAKDALKRRADITDAIDKNEIKLYDLRKQNIDVFNYFVDFKINNSLGL